MNIPFNLPDERLNSRAIKSYEKIIKNYDKPFPLIFSEYADLEGFYRFIKNERYDEMDLMNSITESTLNSIDEDLIGIIHDTTQINPRMNKKSHFLGQRGILSHLSLAVSASSLPHVYGPINLNMWLRDKKNKKILEGNENLRWAESALVSEQLLRAEGKKAIHLMDREGDSSETLSSFVENDCRFVVRTCHNRKIKDDKYDDLYSLLHDLKPVLRVKTKASKRTEEKLPKQKKIYPKRDARDVVLNITAARVNVKRGEMAGKYLPKELEVNYVRAWEEKPPRGEKAIEWILVTTESIDSKTDILKIINLYKRRWLIEEYFKGLKTGCKLEDKQFEDEISWKKLIVFFLPIATKILNLRSLSSLRVTEVKESLSQIERRVIETIAKQREKKLITGEDYLLEIAKLGGHIQYNGPPGWIVLMRGMMELGTMAKGFALGLKCD